MWLSANDDKSLLPDEPEEAIEKLMASFGAMVLRTAFLYMNDRQLAEDISQEVFIRVFRSWTNFRGDCSVKTWLTRITINLCRDKLGRKATAEEPTDPVQLPCTRGLSVEEDAFIRIERTTILRHWLNMAAPYQEVLYLYYYLDLKTAEIATAVGTPEGTVRSRLNKARKLLKERLLKDGFYDE